MRIVAPVGFLVLLLSAMPVFSQTPNDKLIVPGQRIGKWTLDMTIDTLVRMNGPQNLPLFIGPSPVYAMRRWYSDSDSEIWGQEWFDLHFQAATRGRDAQRLEYIFIESDEFKTDKDIAVGVTRQVVESAYGQPTAVTRITDPRVGTLRLIYDEIGLATVIDRNEIVVKVCVFRARTARALWNF